MYLSRAAGVSCRRRHVLCVGCGDASYEIGYAQTGVLIKCCGMLVMWKSSKQPQVPRSTAESECTAMAHASQCLEGAACLLHTMRLSIGVPSL